MKNIEIPMALYRRLEGHAEGFASPADVIEKILNAYEGNAQVEPELQFERPKSGRDKPKLEFHPSEEQFRKGLINGETAKVVLSYSNGEKAEKKWHTSRFSNTSNLRGNIWSGFLRGWEDKGIVKAEFYLVAGM